MDANVTFNYPNNENGRIGSLENKFISKYFNKPINTGNNMVIGIPNNAWLNPPQEGDEIVVYDSSGLLVGNAPYLTTGSVITVWGDDETTLEKDGLQVGEKMTLQLFRSLNQSIEEINVSRWEEGSDKYIFDGISIAGAINTKSNTDKKLIKVVDLLGRDVNTNSQNLTLIYIYDNGTTEKKLRQ